MKRGKNAVAVCRIQVVLTDLSILPNLRVLADLSIVADLSILASLRILASLCVLAKEVTRSRRHQLRRETRKIGRVSRLRGPGRPQMP